MYREEIALLEKESVTKTAEPAPDEATPEQKPEHQVEQQVNVEPPKPEQEPAQQAQPKNKTSSLVIEKPNYDFIEQLTPEEEKKVYKIEKGKPKENSKPFGKRLRVALFALIVGVCSIWGIVNIIDIANLDSQIAASSTQYDMSLEKYLYYLTQLDQASAKNELFETYPVEPQAPSSIEKQSNWFDRLCNFIARLFGG